MTFAGWRSNWRAFHTHASLMPNTFFPTFNFSLSLSLPPLGDHDGHHLSGFEFTIFRPFSPSSEIKFCAYKTTGEGGRVELDIGMYNSLRNDTRVVVWSQFKYFSPCGAASPSPTEFIGIPNGTWWSLFGCSLKAWWFPRIFSLLLLVSIFANFPFFIGKKWRQSGVNEWRGWRYKLWRSGKHERLQGKLGSSQVFESLSGKLGNLKLQNFPLKCWFLNFFCLLNARRKLDFP